MFKLPKLLSFLLLLTVVACGGNKSDLILDPPQTQESPGPESPEPPNTPVEEEPVVSNVSSKIAFVLEQDDGTFDLYAVDLQDPTSLTLVAEDIYVLSAEYYAYFWNPNQEKIAYSADRDGDGYAEIYLSDLEGSTTKLSPEVTGSHSLIFSWSPDGSKLVYLYQADPIVESNYDLYVSSLEGEIFPLSEGAFYEPDLRSPRWISNEQLIIMAKKDGKRQLYLHSLSEAPIRINQDLAAGRKVYYYKLSPDNSKIAYIADVEVYDKDELYWVDLSNTPLSAPVKVNTAFPDAYSILGYMLWSPDSSYLLYTQVDLVLPLEGGPLTPVRRLYSYETETGSRDIISSDFQTLDGTLRGVNSSAWSPDGSKIAYTADQDVEGFTELYVVDWPAGSIHKANAPTSCGAGIREFSWSPDSRYLAYDCLGVLNINLEYLHVYDTVNLQSQILSENYLGDLGVKREIDQFIWSPSSNHLVYQSNQAASDFNEVFLISPTGSPIQANPDLLASEDAKLELYFDPWSPDGRVFVYKYGGSDKVTAVYWMESGENLVLNSLFDDFGPIPVPGLSFFAPDWVLE
ncbi:MAG: PD40 domain-containing protein [Deltaproteobacteria bacterium]|nr:PD40 domain-containing protein [Deltaproteobacteria bacterium]